MSDSSVKEDRSLEEALSILKIPEPTKQHQKFHWTGSFDDYLQQLIHNPAIARSSFQRTYDMIYSWGSEVYEENKKKITHWNFFDDPIDHGKDAVFGLDVHLQKLVHTIKAGAYRYGPEKRVILLHGPVGSSKSTIARMLKKGLEHYSRTDDGLMYCFDWIGLKDIVEMEDEFSSPMHEDPLLLVPESIRQPLLQWLNEDLPRQNQVWPSGELCPPSRVIFKQLLNY